MFTKLISKINYLAKENRYNKHYNISLTSKFLYKIKNAYTILHLIHVIYIKKTWITFQTQNPELKLRNIHALRKNPKKEKLTYFFYYDLLEIAHFHIPVPLVPNFIFKSVNLKLEFTDTFFYGE